MLHVRETTHFKTSFKNYWFTITYLHEFIFLFFYYVTSLNTTPLSFPLKPIKKDHFMLFSVITMTH